MFAKITEQDRGCYLTTAMRHCGELVYTVVKLTPEQYKKVCEMLGEIELGITCNGTDTKLLEKDQGFMIQTSMRSYPTNHPACWGLLVSEGGRAYRAHCGRFELECMIKDYEQDQKMRKELIQKGFQEMKVIKVDTEDENEDNENFIKMLNQYSLKDYIHETALLVEESRYTSYRSKWINDGLNWIAGWKWGGWQLETV